MTDLYLIRHGEALGAVHNIIGDTALSPRGVTQAERLRDRLAATGEIAADVFISSTFIRARQTAEIIAPALGLPIVFDDEVQELRDGAAYGIPIDEYRAKFGEISFRETPFRRATPNSESWGEFALRAAMALDRISRQHEGKTIVVVCHGGVIAVSFLYFFGMSTTQLPQVGLDTYNTSITHWSRRSYNSRPGRWWLVRYNDDMHLRDIQSTVRIPWEALSARRAGGAKQPAMPLVDQEE